MVKYGIKTEDGARAFYENGCTYAIYESEGKIYSRKLENGKSGEAVFLFYGEEAAPLHDGKFLIRTRENLNYKNKEDKNVL